MASQTDSFVEELREKVRPVKEEDNKNGLPVVSYSKLDLFENCNRRYKLKYIDKQYSNVCSIATEIGSILHYGLELKGLSKIHGDEKTDYDSIIKAVHDGVNAEENDGENLTGIDTIKKKFFQEWYAKDEASGLNYEDKMDIYFNKVLPTRMEDNGWKVVGTEIPFNFVYDDRVIINGFIDREDCRIDDPSIMRITDYKSSKKVFDESKIKTPLQMVIYDLASLFLYNEIPEFHEYDFILLDKKQTAEDGVCSKGYLKRGIKKLNGILDRIDKCKADKLYVPSPTPLCYWCEFAPRAHTPHSDPRYGNLCPYYSLWKPDNKVFGVNKQFVIGEEEKPVRKLVF